LRHGKAGRLSGKNTGAEPGDQKKTGGKICQKKEEGGGAGMKKCLFVQTPMLTDRTVDFFDSKPECKRTLGGPHERRKSPRKTGLAEQKGKCIASGLAPRHLGLGENKTCQQVEFSERG